MQRISKILSMDRLCADTTLGSQCWNVDVNVTQEVVSNQYQFTVTLSLTDVDTDGDGTIDTQDADDDNDGVPDYVDPEPLNAANSSLWPLDGSYKGSAVSETVSP